MCEDMETWSLGPSQPCMKALPIGIAFLGSLQYKHKKQPQGKIEIFKLFRLL